MKNIIKIACVLMVSVLLFSCVPANKTQTATAQALKREWKMVSFENYSKDMLMKANAGINLAQSKDGKQQYGAYFGCNQMFFTLEQSGSILRFKNMGGTMMYCENTMELESAAAKFLQEGDIRYAISGHYLTLTNAAGKTMKLIAADWD